jgi:hypothetical protein
MRNFRIQSAAPTNLSCVLGLNFESKLRSGTMQFGCQQAIPQYRQRRPSWGRHKTRGLLPEGHKWRADHVPLLASGVFGMPHPVYPSARPRDHLQQRLSSSAAPPQASGQRAAVPRDPELAAIERVLIAALD